MRGYIEFPKIPVQEDEDASVGDVQDALNFLGNEVQNAMLLQERELVRVGEAVDGIEAATQGQPATWHLDVDRHLNHGTLATSGATITADTDPQVDDTQDLFLNSIPQRRVIEFRGNVENGTWAADMEKGESYCLGGYQNETYPVQGGTIVGASFWVAGPTDPPFVSGDLTFTLQYATLTDMETNSNANTLIALGPGLNISASTPALWYKSLNIPIPDEVLSIEMNGYATSFAGNPHAFARVFIEDWPPAPFPVPTGGRTLKGFTAHMRNRFDTGCSIRVYPITQAAPVV